MKCANEELLSDVAAYYSSKFNEYGETPRGVDWNGKESQYLRFKQLSKILEAKSNFSIHDLGCGYGSFYDYLSDKYKDFLYHGIDISSTIIQAAEKRYLKHKNAHFVSSHAPEIIADYSIASGIFNVQTTKTDTQWEDYLKSTLDTLNNFSRRGFAFNCLTSYSDPEKMQAHLYYANPTLLFDFCKQHYSKNVALLHDYGLYEFTILVRKTL